jgi:methyl-accepting chemotaxis protein
MSSSIVALILVGIAVIFVMYNNINKITQKIESGSSRGYEFFASLAGAAIEYIKDIKRDIKGVNETPEFVLVNSDSTKPLKDLDDYIRKLAFYETVLAKKKDTKDIESEIADIFISFDSYIKNNFQSGDTLASNLKESLGKIYQNR